MIASRIKAATVVLLMLAAFAGAKALRPTVHLSDTLPKIELETIFPKSIGPWIVDTRMPVQLVSPDTAALLSKIYNQTLSRTYVNAKGDRIMLSVAYGGDQSDGTRAHRPEVCYPAQGFAVNSMVEARSTATGRALPVRRLVAALGNRIEPITYWVVVGDAVALSGSEQKMAQLRYSLKGIIPDGLLMRVSTIDANAAKAFALHEQFLADLHQALAPDWRSRVFGSNVAGTSI